MTSSPATFSASCSCSVKDTTQVRLSPASTPPWCDVVERVPTDPHLCSSRLPELLKDPNGEQHDGEHHHLHGGLPPQSPGQWRHAGRCVLRFCLARPPCPLSSRSPSVTSTGFILEKTSLTIRDRGTSPRPSTWPSRFSTPSPSTSRYVAQHQDTGSLDLLLSLCWSCRVRALGTSRAWPTAACGTPWLVSSTSSLTCR